MRTIHNTHPDLAQAIHETAINPKERAVNLNKLEDLVIEAATLINPDLAESISLDLNEGALLQVVDSDEFDEDCQVTWEFTSVDGTIDWESGTLEQFMKAPADIMIRIGFRELVNAPLLEQAAAA